MFGVPATTTAPTSFFGGASTTAAPSMFGQPQQAQSAPLQASIDQNPYGANPLYNVAIIPGTPAFNLRESPMTIPMRAPPTKAPALPPHFSITPRSASTIKIRGFTPSITSTKSNNLTNRDVGSLALQPAFTPRRNMKKLVLDLTENGSVSQNSAIKKPSSISDSARKSVSFNSTAERQPAYFEPASQVDISIVPDTPTPIHTRSPPRSPIQTRTPTTFKSPTKPDYQMNPTFNELMQYSDEELRSVNGFEISLDGVGSVKFLEPVDLLDVSPTQDRRGIKLIAASLVIISHCSCTVYPDDLNKPERNHRML